MYRLSSLCQLLRVSPPSIVPRCSVPSRSFLLGPVAPRGLHLDRPCAPAILARTEERGTDEQQGSGHHAMFQVLESSPSGCALVMCLVDGGVVGGAGVPAGPDDADPGAGDDADRVRVALAACSGIGVELGRPGRLLAGVVGVGGDGLAARVLTARREWTARLAGPAVARPVPRSCWPAWWRAIRPGRWVWRAVERAAERVSWCRGKSVAGRMRPCSRAGALPGERSAINDGAVDAPAQLRVVAGIGVHEVDRPDRCDRRPEGKDGAAPLAATQAASAPTVAAAGSAAKRPRLFTISSR
jgi:hypothetical protein